MKQYVKPVCEKVELQPNERLSNSSCEKVTVHCNGEIKEVWTN